MKVLYISGSEFPSNVSHTLSKMRMCQALTNAGHDVILSAFKSGIETDDIIAYYGLNGGFKLQLISLPPWLNGEIAKKLQLKKFYAALHNRKIIEQFQPDAIYSRLTLFELLFVPKTLPIIYEMHSLGFLGKTWIIRTLFKILVRAKSFIRFVSSTNTLASLLIPGLPNSNIVVARLSAEPPVEIEVDKMAAFKNGQLQGGDFNYHVGYTGYLDTVGLRGTEIICQLAAKLPEVAFHIVGGHKIAVEHWKNYGRDYNKNGNLFFYGHRNPAEIPYFLNCFDIVLAPLQHKPTSRAPIGENMSPLKLPQYMAYSKSIVASDLPAHREVLEEGRTALLVKCDDVDAWADAIKNLINDPDKRNKMGGDAYKEYLQGYTPMGRIKSIMGGMLQSQGVNDVE